MIVCTLNMEMARRRMNIEKLSKASGLARSTVSMLYNDKAKRIDFDTMDKLCKALDTTPGKLFAWIEEPLGNE